ncbi:MAG: IS3 family transposase [Bacteroidales bacterium]|nr:IS3 family transposase [Bacteroidales bacterium]
MEQRTLLSISHSGFYYISATERERNLSIMNAIDKIHSEYPFYGFRRIPKELGNHGFFIGEKLIIRLMKLMRYIQFTRNRRRLFRTAHTRRTPACCAA